MTSPLELLKRLPIEPYIDRAREAYEELNERERYIVLGVIGAVVLIIITVVISAMFGSLGRLEKRIASEGEVARKIEELKSSYFKSRTAVTALEELVKRTGSDFSLASYLESKAKGYGIAPDSMNPKPVAPNDLYSENQVEVRINKVTLKALIDYLYDIENSTQLIRVNALSIKPNFSDPAFLTVVFSVSSFGARG